MRLLLAPLALLLAGTLFAQVAPTPPVTPVPAPPAPGTLINLARTSLAAINASGVNGKRALDNEYYGVHKAFDDGGKPGPGGITYNYWLAEAGDNRPWVEIRFDTPVEVRQVVALGGPPFRAEFKWKGDYEYVGKADDAFKPDKPASDVTAVRLTFEPKDSPARVDEIRVLGTAPAAAKFTVQTPRLVVTPQSAAFAAGEAFDKWKVQMFAGAQPQTTDTPDAIITTYRVGDTEVLRVTVRKSDGQTTVEPLARIAPAGRSGPASDPHF
jgi:hypothetical protein